VVVIERSRAMAEAGGQNALLKTLEEPGRGVLESCSARAAGSACSHHPSRCQQIPFARLDCHGDARVLGSA